MNQQGDCHPNDQFEAHRDDREIHRTPDGFPEGRVLEHLEVVPQSDEGAHLVDTGGGMIKAQDKRIDDRPQGDTQDDHQAWDDQEPGGTGILLPQGAPSFWMV